MLKRKIHNIHILAVVILTSYLTLSKINYVHALTNVNHIFTFFQLYIYGSFFAVLFLFIFSHEHFFKFAKDLENTEKKKEKAYLDKYLHFGKVLSTFIIGTIGGPIFGSLSARLLINKNKFKYLIVVLANIPSTFIAMGLGKGIILFIKQIF